MKFVQQGLFGFFLGVGLLHGVAEFMGETSNNLFPILCASLLFALQIVHFSYMRHILREMDVEKRYFKPRNSDLFTTGERKEDSKIFSIFMSENYSNAGLSGEFK